MGPGIFTKYSKQVFGGLLTLLVLIAAIALYYRFRGPIGGESPYKEVNDFFEQERISFTIEKEIYPADVEVVLITLRNDTEDTVVAPPAYKKNDWLLETRVNGAWHSMRRSPFSNDDSVDWDFPPEEYGPNSGPSGVVNWNGGEQRFLCNIAKYYQTPLAPGLYRIVFPDMEHRDTATLAVEFHIEEMK